MKGIGSTESGRVLRRIRWLTALFIVGLALSGATAIPVRAEVDWLLGLDLTRSLLGASGNGDPAGLGQWLTQVQTALHDVDARYPFVNYGADWLAFGHFAIAIAFLGALRDPVRNRWLYSFGMIACALVVPYAFLFGSIRGIPLYWRLIDSSFGIFGFLPLWPCYRWVHQLEAASKEAALARSD